MTAEPEGVSYRQKYVRCGKPTCGSCLTGNGHGPYWYARWRSAGRLHTRYVGKTMDPTRAPSSSARHELVSHAPTPGGPHELKGGSRWHFRVQTLGHFAVDRCTDDGVVVPLKWRRSTAAAIFRLLLVQGSLTRNEIGASLFPEDDAHTVQRALDGGLHALRVALEPGRARSLPSQYLVQRGSSFALNLGSTAVVDCQTFTQAIDTVRRGGCSVLLLESIAGLYGGDLLPDESGLWCIPQRERLHMDWQYLLLHLATAYFGQQAYVESLTPLRRLLLDDPLYEDAVCLMMRAHGRLGRYAEALRTYRRFETNLRLELGATPRAHTQQLAAAMRTSALTR